MLTDAYSTRFAIEYNPAKAVSFILPLHARSPVFPALAACHRATPWTPVIRELPLALPLRLWGIAHSPALYKGVRGSGWDPAPSRERVGDWGGPETVWALLCVAARRATSPNGECCPAFVVCGAVIPGDLVTRQQFRARQHLFVQWRMGRRYSTRRHVLEPERPEAV